MHLGAVAMLDALGFKGIWRRASARTVLANMKSLRTLANERVRTPEESPRDFEGADIAVRCELISDTIAVGAFLRGSLPEGTSSERVASAIAANAMISVADLVREGLALNPSLVYRGAIAFGSFDMDEGFLIGEAVDAAAAAMDQAEGAFVWLLPSVARHLTSDSKKNPGAVNLRPCNVPLKSGRAIETWAVAPYWNWADGGAAIERVLQAMESDQLDVIVKRQNTERWLRSCLAADRRAHDDAEEAQPESRD